MSLDRIWNVVTWLMTRKARATLTIRLNGGVEPDASTVTLGCEEIERLMPKEK